MLNYGTAAHMVFLIFLILHTPLFKAYNIICCDFGHYHDLLDGESFWYVTPASQSQVPNRT